MIHTVEFSIQLDYEHINFRKDHYGKEPINQILHRHMMKGISSVEYCNRQVKLNSFPQIILNSFHQLRFNSWILK